MAMYMESGEPGLVRQLGVVRRRWLVVAAMVVAVVTVAVASSLTQTTRYRAEVEVDLREPASLTALGFVSASNSPRSLANEVELAESGSVQAAARSQVGNEPRFGVRSHPTADIVIVEASSADPATAARAADEYAAAFVAQRQGRMASELLAAAADAADAELRTRLLLAADLVESTAVPRVSPAEHPSDPTGRGIGATIGIAMLVGLALGVAATFVVERLDRSLRSEGDLLRVGGGVACLGVIPELAGGESPDQPVLAARDHVDSPTASAYQSLRTSLALASRDRSQRIIAVTGPSAGVGSTTTAVNVALIAAQAGQRTVLIDCSLRQPRVHEFFGLSNDVGFTTVLLGDGALEGAAHRIADEPGLVVLTSGPPASDPAELLAGKRASSLVKAVAGQADLVVLDIDPLLDSVDPIVAAALVDAVLVIASAGDTTSDDLAEALARLRRAERPVLGTVLNRVGARSRSARSPASVESPERSTLEE